MSLSIPSKRKKNLRARVRAVLFRILIRPLNAKVLPRDRRGGEGRGERTIDIVLRNSFPPYEIKCLTF